MKTRWSVPLFVAALVLAAAAHAQPGPDQVTDAQVATYKKEFDQNCRIAGERRGEAPAQVAVLCNCLVKAVLDSATDIEWRQAYFLSRQGRAQEEAQVMGSYIVRAAPRCGR